MAYISKFPWWVYALGALGLGFLLINIALAITTGTIAGQASNEKHKEDKAVNQHFNILDGIIRLLNTTTPWYDVISVPTECLDSIIIRKETKEGYR
jgi:hypothetical protein